MKMFYSVMEFLEQCCDFMNYSSDISLALLVGTVLATLLIYFCHRWGQIKFQKDDGVCQSSSCLRCNANESFQEITKRKFSIYLNKCQRPDLLSNLKNAILVSSDGQLVNDKHQKNEKTFQNPSLLWLTSIEPNIWFNPESTYERDVKILENSFPIILDEYLNLGDQPGWIVNEKKIGWWKVYHLMSQGIFTVNATACPRTVDVLKQLDNLMVGTVFGYATFSVLGPGTVITPHFGATNCRIRCHLGLQVDPATCYLEVANQRRSWEKGKCLLFDDSFLHCAYHTGAPESPSRVILMVDLWHSSLNQDEIQCIHSVYSSDLIFECSSFTKTN